MAVAQATGWAGTGRQPLGCRLISRAEEYYDLCEGTIQNPRRRNGNVSKARWAVSHVLKNDAGWTYPRIAKLFGQDHKGIMYGCNAATKLLRECPLFFECVRLLQEEISPHVENRDL